MISFLAQLPSPESPQAVGWVMIIISSLMLSVNQGLGIIQYFRDPLKTQRIEDLERINAESKMRKQDSDKRIGAVEKMVDDFAKQVGGFATTAQLRELKDDVHNRLKEMSAYLHDTHHGITGEIRALYVAGEQRGKEVHEAAILLNTQNEERAAKLHETITSVRSELAGDQRSLRSRVDMIAEEMPRKIIELLKSTGHLNMPGVV